MTTNWITVTLDVQRLLKEAEQVDAQEDAEHGKGKRGDGLPQELARRESRLLKIREAKAALEAEAGERAEAEASRGAAALPSTMTTHDAVRRAFCPTNS
jgi:hypothetical protein